MEDSLNQSIDLSAYQPSEEEQQAAREKVAKELREQMAKHKEGGIHLIIDNPSDKSLLVIAPDGGEMN